MRACFIEKMTIWSPRLCPVENSIKRARTKGFIWITTSLEQLWTFYRVKWNFGRTGRFVGASSYYGLKMARTWLIVRIIDVKTDSISVFFVLFTLRLLVSVMSEISETRRRRVHCMQRIEQCVSLSVPDTPDLCQQFDCLRLGDRLSFHGMVNWFKVATFIIKSGGAVNWIIGSSSDNFTFHVSFRLRYEQD